MKNWIDDKVLERCVEPLYICGSMNGSYIIYAPHDSWAVKRERDYKGLIEDVIGVTVDVVGED